MENKMFLALVLFGLVSLGLAIDLASIPNIQTSNYVDDIGVNVDNDKLSKQEINIPNIQSIHGGSKSEKDKPSHNGLHWDIKSLLSQIHQEEGVGPKKDIKSSEPEPKKEHKKSSESGLHWDIKSLLSQIQQEQGVGPKKDVKSSEPEPKKEIEKSSESEPKKDINEAAKEGLKKKVAKLIKLQSSLKHVREHHHTRELNKEKVQEVGQDKGKPAEDDSPLYRIAK